MTYIVEWQSSSKLFLTKEEVEAYVSGKNDFRVFFNEKDYSVLLKELEKPKGEDGFRVFYGRDCSILDIIKEKSSDVTELFYATPREESSRERCQIWSKIMSNLRRIFLSSNILPIILILGLSSIEVYSYNISQSETSFSSHAFKSTDTGSLFDTDNEMGEDNNSRNTHIIPYIICSSELGGSCDLGDEVANTTRVLVDQDDDWRDNPFEYLMSKRMPLWNKEMISAFYSFVDDNSIWFDRKLRLNYYRGKEDAEGRACTIISKYGESYYRTQGVKRAYPFVKPNQSQPSPFRQKVGEDVILSRIDYYADKYAMLLHNDSYGTNYLCIPESVEYDESRTYMDMQYWINYPVIMSYASKRNYNDEEFAQAISDAFGGISVCNNDGSYSRDGNKKGTWSLSYRSAVRLSSGKLAIHCIFILTDVKTSGYYTLPGKTVSIMGQPFTIGGGTITDVSKVNQYYNAVVLLNKDTSDIERVLPLPFHSSAWTLYASRNEGFWFVPNTNNYDGAIDLNKGETLYYFDEDGNIRFQFTNNQEGFHYLSFDYCASANRLLLAGATNKHGYIGYWNPCVASIDINNPNDIKYKYFAEEESRKRRADMNLACIKVVCDPTIGHEYIVLKINGYPRGTSYSEAWPHHIVISSESLF